MSDDRSFDLKKSVMMRLSDSDVIASALRTRVPKRRVGMVMSEMKRVMSGVPIGNFNGELYKYGGKCWVRMGESEFAALINDVMEAIGLPYEDMMLCDKVVKVCRNEVMKKVLCPQDNIVVFDNCVFDVDRRMEFAFSPRYVQMSKVGYSHCYNDRPFEWLNFLEYVLPEEGKRRCLQEFLGSVFVDRKKAKIEKIMILLGNGANGKSVIFDTIIGVLGRDNVTNFGLGTLIGGSERKHSVAGINGKRLNYCSEIRAIEIGQDSDALKTLISGEPIEARVLNGQYFMARNIPLLMANANKMPRITDMSHGMKRRLCVLRFSVTVPRDKQDPRLSERLVSEYPGIFNWIIEGKERFVKNGYKLSFEPDIDDVLREQNHSDSTTLRFMHVKKWYSGEVDSGEPCVWRRSSHIYKEYVKWCMSEHIIPDSNNLFGRTLAAFGYRKRRVSKGYEIAVYGKQMKQSVVTDAAAVMKVVKQKKDASASAWVTVDGNPMILGNRRLALALGVGLKTVDKCIEKGWLDGCFERVSSGWHAYDLVKCRKVMEEHDIFKPGFRVAELRSERAQKALDRNTFNRRMEGLELPYRKMAHRDRVAQGCVWVPDNYTVDHVLLIEKNLHGAKATEEDVNNLNIENDGKES